MFSSVQAVFLFDVNSFHGTCESERALEQHVARLKLASLKLLTEFGAHTEKGRETVSWSWKYYDSFNFKPDTAARRDFVDFTRDSYDDFENDLTDKYCKAFDKLSGNNNSSNDLASSSTSRPHYFILKKALQEVLLDYNWDRPDISSPVKPVRRKSNAVNNKILPQNSGPYNTVIVCTKVPQNERDLKLFLGCSQQEKDVSDTVKVSADDYIQSILDSSTRKGFKEDKKIHLNIIDLTDSLDLTTGDINPQFGSVIKNALAKLNGGLHCISKLVQSAGFRIAEHEVSLNQIEVFPTPVTAVGSVAVQASWWRHKSARPRRPQPGPTLIWEDGEGISYLQVQLEMLAVYGSSSQNWENAVVVGVVRSSAVSILAIAGGGGHLYVCHAPNTIFTTLVHVLAQYQLSVVLKMSCGGVAILCPWTAGVGCLAVLSSSGMATTPLQIQETNQEKNHMDRHLLKFVAQTVEKCLKMAPRHIGGEPVGTTKRFAAHQTEKWFKPMKAYSEALQHIRRRKNSKNDVRRAMQDRLQKRYRPQIPRPLTNGELGVLDLVDISQPPARETEPAAAAAAATATASAKATMSRAQQLVKKSHIVTAQQKVKEQRAEEEERFQATERRVAQASERARKSQQLESQVLNTVTDPQDTEELVRSLISLRDGAETDLFTTAQTIINLALSHVKKTNETDMEEGLRKVLSCGVLQTTSEIASQHPTQSRLQQYKLQSLLHLEMLWVFGYSSSSKVEDNEDEGRGDTMKEYHMEEIMKMLRAISLRHNPTEMATFLQEVILENYVETLGEVLVDIYEELNQPLPEPLRVLTGDPGSVMDTRPSSVKSHGSSNMSYDSVGGSVENPGSGKSRDGRRTLSRHPSVKEVTKRQLVIPMVTRGLKRTNSEQAKPSTAPSKDANNDVRKVRRNLFDLSNAGVRKPRMQRSQTVASLSELRRSPRKKHSVSDVTPRKEKREQISAKQTHLTPCKNSVTPVKGLKTPKTKKGTGVLAPETPGDKIGLTIYNKKRICKSTGTTVVSESPDIKKMSNPTPRRLRASLTVTRRNCFYSGARSRNWERAKTQLLADRIRGHSERSEKRSLDSSSSQYAGGDASFLFSEIFTGSSLNSSVQQEEEHEGNKRVNTSMERKVIDFGLDEVSTDAAENFSSNLPGTSSQPPMLQSPARNTRSKSTTNRHSSLTSGIDSRRTPVKSVRRALSLCTPSKILVPVSFKSPERTVKHSLPRESSRLDITGTSTPTKWRESPLCIRKLNDSAPCPNTPNSENRRNPELTSNILAMTPSKRVQFSLTLTPSKHSSSNPQTPRNHGTPHSNNPQTPKSILKTPGKTPNKTPTKLLFNSPDIFASSLKERVQSPTKTPLKKGSECIISSVKRIMQTPVKEQISESSLPSTKASLETPVKTPLKEIQIHPPPMSSPKLSSQDSSVSPRKQANLPKELFSPVKVNKLISFEESEIELMSPSKKSLTLDQEQQTPKKSKFQKALCIDSPKRQQVIDDKEGEQSSERAHSIDDDAKNTDPVSVPKMDPQDVEMINSLMFGTESEIGTTAELVEDGDGLKFDFNGILHTLTQSPSITPDQTFSSIVCSTDEECGTDLLDGATQLNAVVEASRAYFPEKQMPLHSADIESDSYTSEKQIPLFDLKSILELEKTPEKDKPGSDSETVDPTMSPVIALDSVMKRRIEKLNTTSDKEIDDEQSLSSNDSEIFIRNKKKRSKSPKKADEETTDKKYSSGDGSKEALDEQERNDSIFVNERSYQKLEKMSSSKSYLENISTVSQAVVTKRNISVSDDSVIDRKGVSDCNESTSEREYDRKSEEITNEKENDEKSDKITSERENCKKSDEVTSSEKENDMKCDEINNEIENDKVTSKRENYTKPDEVEITNERESDKEPDDRISEKENDEKSDEITNERDDDKISADRTTEKDNDKISDDRTSERESDRESNDRTDEKENDKLSDEGTSEKENDKLLHDRTAEKENDKESNGRTSEKENDKHSDERTNEKENDNLFYDRTTERKHSEERTIGREKDKRSDERTSDIISVEKSIKTMEEQLSGEIYKRELQKQIDIAFQANAKRSVSKKRKSNSASDAVNKVIKTELPNENLVCQENKKLTSRKRKSDQSIDRVDSKRTNCRQKPKKVMASNDDKVSVDRQVCTPKRTRDRERRNSDKRYSERVRSARAQQKARGRGKVRACKEKIESFKEYSSSGEEEEDFFLESLPVSPAVSETPASERRSSSRGKKKRIFDDDSDFISPIKIKADSNSDTMPLKNVENIPTDALTKSGRLSASSDTVDSVTRKENVAESKRENPKSPIEHVSSPDRKCKQQKIDVYLSPIHKHTPYTETVPTSIEKSVLRKRPVTPNDWKRVKPRRKNRKIHEVKSNLESDSSVTRERSSDAESSRQDVDSSNVKKRKSRRRRVRLKITRSGDHYQVTENNSSVGSDPNSSSDVLLSSRQDESHNSSSFLSSSDTPSTKKKKKDKDKSMFITPLRFTRHMSKDISVTPELFQQLITLSPDKNKKLSSCIQEDNEKVDSDMRKSEIMPRKSLTNSFNERTKQEHLDKSELQSLPSQDSPKGQRKDKLASLDDEWTVQNVPGSPTMKTFIRKQKLRHSIASSPRIELSPLEDKSKGGITKLLKPSIHSLVHLSVSPIIQNKVLVKEDLPDDTSLSNKPKSSRRLYQSRQKSYD